MVPVRKKTKPKKLWAFWSNLYGPFYRNPIQVKYDESLKSYWDNSGEWEVKEEGLYQREAYLCFASKTKKDVELFIQGYLAAKHLVAYVCKG